MNNKYLVIKLPGNWIDREQIKQRVKMMLGVDVLDERQVVTCTGTQCISVERKRNDAGYEEYMKHLIAGSIGQGLAAEGLMSFTEEQKIDGMVRITGEITVIKEDCDERDTE